MKNYIKYLFMLSVCICTLATFYSCDKFLEENPSKSSNVEVKTVEHLDGLLANFYNFYREDDIFCIQSADTYDIPVELYSNERFLFLLSDIQNMLWDVDNISKATRDQFFTSEFRKVFYANMVLGYINKVTGSDKMKSNLVAEAHFVRAYSYFLLADVYCLPYSEANFNELGLPKKTDTSYEQSLKRMSLKETYDFIEADLKEALKTTNEDIQQRWRGNLYAVKAFAARFYLAKGDYVNANKYAQEVLTKTSDLIDYNTEMRYGRDNTINVNGETKVLKFPYTHDNRNDLTDRINWKEFLFFRVKELNSWWFIPSKSLLDSYDKVNDLRYKYHIVEDYSFDRGATSYSYPGYVFFYKYEVPAGPTTAEMILIKAECQARIGNYTDAMSTLSILRAKRMLPGAHINLVASSKEDAINKVIEERKRECPFSLRWYDIRRLNNNNVASDDIPMTRTFFPYNNTRVLYDQAPKQYTLSPRRYAAPFTEKEIYLSRGQLEQNRY